MLPMKRSQDHQPSCGIIFGDPIDNKVWFIPGANIWRIADGDLNKNGKLVSIDDLLAEGWEVD